MPASAAAGQGFGGALRRRRGHRRPLRRSLRRDVLRGRRRSAPHQPPAARRRPALRPDHRLRGRHLRHETEVKIRRQEPCDACNGSGSASGRGPTICGQCQGRGQVRFQQGFFSVARTCPACGGTGQVIGDPCSTCRGETRVTKETQAQRQGAARRRERNPHPLRRRRRRRTRRRAQGRPLRRPLHPLP